MRVREREIERERERERERGERERVKLSDEAKIHSRETKIARLTVGQ